MQVATIPAARLHPVFAQIVRTAQQAYGMAPSPPHPPELVRQLLGQQPAQSEHSADAI